MTGEGVTRNVSSRGAYIVSATCPPVNATVRMKISLPQPAGGALITGKMRVQRVEHRRPEKKSGFSALGKGFASRSDLRHSHSQAEGKLKH
jgi:hypothetical protein